MCRCRPDGPVRAVRPVQGLEFIPRLESRKDSERRRRYGRGRPVMAAVGMRRGSSMRTRSLSAWVGVVAMAALSTILAAPAGATDLATYEVTITDLTGGQPLTPPVIATHNGGIHIFQVGRPASFEVKEIAENGNLAPLASSVGASGRVFDVEAVFFPLVLPGHAGSGALHSSPPAPLRLDAARASG